MRHASGDGVAGSSGPGDAASAGRSAADGGVADGGPSRIEGLDGLRALAILGVLAFHAGVASGGFLGVQVFFVVSGFLITTLLVRERRRLGRVHLRAFYVRRLARLTPGLVVSIAVIVPVWILATPFAVRGALITCLTSLTYLTNWAATFHNGPLPGPSYTWTLAQEEQFYLVIPMVVAGLRPASYARVARCCVGLAIGLGVARIGLQAALPGAAWSLYTNPVLNLDCLLIGVGLALHLAARGPRRREVASPARPWAVPAIAVLMVVAPMFGPWAGAATLAVALLTVRAIHQVTAGAGTAVLEWRPVRWVGTRSYAIYLFNVPALLLFDGLRTGHRLLYVALSTALTLALSEAVTRWLETPARKAAHRYLAARSIPTPRTPRPVSAPVA